MGKAQTGKNLLMIRKARNMTAEELAASVNTSVLTVYNHQRNGIGTIDMLIRYCNSLGCEPGDLLSDTVDFDRYKTSDDIANKYPWNLALAVMAKNGEPTEHDQIYKVYIPELLNAVKSLSEREQSIIDMRYRRKMTLEQVGRKYGLSRERIRQIEIRAIRKLQYPSIRKNYMLDTLGRIATMQCEIDALKRENKALKDGVATYNRSIKEQEAENYASIPIEYLELSVRSFNCLRRAECFTLGDVEKLTVGKMKQIRNMGQRSMSEIIEAAKKYGIEIR